VELKSRLEARLGRAIPAMMTFNFPSVRALSTRLAADFVEAIPSSSGNGLKNVPGSVTEDAKNEDQVAQLLAETLHRIQSRRGVLNWQ
jgi:hypothetical protein